MLAAFSPRIAATLARTVLDAYAGASTASFLVSLGRVS